MLAYIICFVFAASAAGVEPPAVINGDFETACGESSGKNGSWSFCVPEGWASKKKEDVMLVSSGPDVYGGLRAASGTKYIALLEHAIMWQYLHFLPGDNYTMTFYVTTPPHQTRASKFRVQATGHMVVVLEDILTPGQFKKLTMTFEAMAKTGGILFMSVSGTVLLDAVSISSTPTVFEATADRETNFDRAADEQQQRLDSMQKTMDALQLKFKQMEGFMQNVQLELQNSKQIRETEQKLCANSNQNMSEQLRSFQRTVAALAVNMEHMNASVSSFEATADRTTKFDRAAFDRLTSQADEQQQRLDSMQQTVDALQLEVKQLQEAGGDSDMKLDNFMQNVQLKLQHSKQVRETARKFWENAQIDRRFVEQSVAAMQKDYANSNKNMSEQLLSFQRAVATFAVKMEHMNASVSSFEPCLTLLMASDIVFRQWFKIMQFLTTKQEFLLGYLGCLVTMVLMKIIPYLCKQTPTSLYTRRSSASVDVRSDLQSHQAEDTSGQSSIAHKLNIAELYEHPGWSQHSLSESSFEVVEAIGAELDTAGVATAQVHTKTAHSDSMSGNGLSPAGAGVRP